MNGVHPLLLAGWAALLVVIVVSLVVVGRRRRPPAVDALDHATLQRVVERHEKDRVGDA